MPVESAVLSVAIVAVFAVFMAVLAWGTHVAGRRPD